MELQALNYVPVPVVVLDRVAPDRFEYVWMNDASAAFSGLSLADIRGKSPRDVFPGRAGDQLAHRQISAAQSGESATYTYPLRLPSGERWIETNLEPVLDTTGQVIRLIATMQDRTAEHALEVHKTATDSTMRSMESEIEQYISMAAHDLRTPMNNVQEIVSLLVEDFDDHGDGKLELIEALEHVAVSASTLISEVLSFSRASSVAETRREVELMALAIDIFAVLDPREEHCLTSHEGLLLTDPIALQIALRNLVDNALKHAGTGQTQVHINFEGEADGFLQFSVRDNGRGFDDPSAAFLEGGDFKFDSGFGLLGIKRMIQSRGGEISAMRPENGQGSLIRFTLPGTCVSEQVNIDPIGFRVPNARSEAATL